jgi:hypothetical protein
VFVLLFYRKITPYGLRPAGIALLPTNNMKMHLWYHVTKPGKIDLGKTKHLLDISRNGGTVCQNPVTMVLGQIQQIIELRIRHENEPGQCGITMQEHFRTRKASQVMTVRQ